MDSLGKFLNRLDEGDLLPRSSPSPQSRECGSCMMMDAFWTYWTCQNHIGVWKSRTPLPALAKMAIANLRFRWATWRLLPGFVLPSEGRELFKTAKRSVIIESPDATGDGSGNSSIEYVKHDITTGGGVSHCHISGNVLLEGAMSWYCQASKRKWSKGQVVRRRKRVLAGKNCGRKGKPPSAH